MPTIKLDTHINRDGRPPLFALIFFFYIVERTWKAKKTNKEVLNKLGLQSTKLMTVVRQRIVRFYGHVRRHDSLQRIITEGMVNGKCGRGRKRCGWLGNVSRYAGMNINRCAEIATNREEWRTIVSNVVSDKEQR